MNNGNPFARRLNTSLFTKTLTRFESGIVPYDPTGCRTEEGMCFPALAADLSGGQWADSDPDEELGGWLLAERGDPARDVLRIVHPHDRAARLLGVSLHFGDEPNLRDLRRLISEAGR